MRLEVAGGPLQHRAGELQRARVFFFLPGRQRPGGVHVVRGRGFIQLRLGQGRLVARQVGLGDAQVVSPQREQQVRQQAQGLHLRLLAMRHAPVGMVARA